MIEYTLLGYNIPLKHALFGEYTPYIRFEIGFFSNLDYIKAI